MDFKSFARKITDKAGSCRLLLEEPMALHTTFRVGGPAAVFAEPENGEQLREILFLCREEGVPCTVIGKGSNLLVGDKGYRGVALHIGDAMSSIRVEGCGMEAEAGCLLSALARTARDHSLAGLEFAAGIPGSLGGALVMNAGAYGGEMKDVLKETLILDGAGELRWLPAGELDLGYRTSRLQKESMVALAARLELQPGDPEAISARMNELAEKRRSKQPLEYPSAGSTFKRPEGHFAGKLIQDAGLSGYTEGGACVSEKHCGFVINKNHGTASDILAVCRHVEEEVEKQTGIRLEMEVRLLGDF